MEDFDWVTARAQCSSGKVFEKLRLQVKKDVETKNLLLADHHDAFALVDNGDHFSVIVPSNPLLKITFSLTKEKISVHRRDRLVCEGTLTLNDDGECRVKINGQQRELWQMRRMALEELFFGS